MKNLAEAEKEYLALKEADPESSRIPLAAYLLGMAFYNSSEEALAAGNKDLWKEHLTKAADYFAFYLTGVTTPLADHYETIGIWRYKLDDFERAAPNLNKALEMLTASLDGLEDKRPENAEFKALSNRIEGITVLLSEILLKNGRFAEAKTFFEDLLIQDQGGKERVMALLKQQEHTLLELQELMKKIRTVPSFMEGYARVLHQLGELDDCLRALTLLRLLSIVDKSNVYQPNWWEWQYLTFQLWLDLGINHGQRQALENIKAKYQEYDGLGVLERSGRKPEFLKIKNQAERGR
jgi:tetratricopeptide (TPR) repeat protein